MTFRLVPLCGGGLTYLSYSIIEPPQLHPEWRIGGIAHLVEPDIKAEVHEIISLPDDYSDLNMKLKKNSSKDACNGWDNTSWTTLSWQSCVHALRQKSPNPSIEKCFWSRFLWHCRDRNFDLSFDDNNSRYDVDVAVVVILVIIVVAVDSLAFSPISETWNHNWPRRETTQWQRGPHIRWGNWFVSRNSFSWLKSFHACTAKIFST